MINQRYVHLQRIVAEAVYDDTFCNRLLNGDRPQVIAKFDLSETEQRVLLGIKADNMESFAQALLNWMNRSNGARHGA